MNRLQKSDVVLRFYHLFKWLRENYARPADGFWTPFHSLPEARLARNSAPAFSKNAKKSL
jgi:hypothetical protein